jgi:U3 small nucleolar RNA-associated protein 21
MNPRKLTKLFDDRIGPDASDPISSMAMEGDAVWAASGSNIIKYHRGKEVRLLRFIVSNHLVYFILSIRPTVSTTLSGAS